MNTKLLDGLEMFLGVGVMLLNSSNSKMAGESRLYRPPTQISCWVAVSLFLRRCRIIRRCLTKGVGSSDPTAFSTVAVEI